MFQMPSFCSSLSKPIETLQRKYLDDASLKHDTCVWKLTYCMTNCLKESMF